LKFDEQLRTWLEKPKTKDHTKRRRVNAQVKIDQIRDKLKKLKVCWSIEGQNA
jgi:hypothetical protein